MKCSNGAIRLADGLTEFEGRVEICYNNRWGGVCGNSWDITEATVVCRQLGHIYFGNLLMCRKVKQGVVTWGGSRNIFSVNQAIKDNFPTL